MQTNTEERTLLDQSSGMASALMKTVISLNISASLMKAISHPVGQLTCMYIHVHI